MTNQIKDKDLNNMDAKIENTEMAEAKKSRLEGPKRLIKKLGFPVLLVGILAYQVGIYAYNHGAVEDAWDPNEWEDMGPVYPTEMVMRQTLEETIYAKGNLETEDEGELKSKASGRLEALYVKEGDYVTEGQTIGRIDSREFMLRYERAKLALDRDLLKAEKDKLEREKEAGQKTATAFYSDVAGQLKNFSLKEGDRVTVGQVIGQVNPYNKLEVVGHFHQGQAAQLRVGDEAEVFLTDFLQTKIGQVKEVGQIPVTDGSGTVRYPVIVEMDNPGGVNENTKVQLSIKKGGYTMTALDRGTVRPAPMLDLKSTVAGVILEPLVEADDIISVGTKILNLDTSGYALEESEQAIADKEREFSIREQRLALVEMENEMKHFTIVAEETGLVSEVHVKQGQQVSAEMKLASLATDSLVVKAMVDELDISKVYLGQEARIESDAYRDEIFLGEVVKIADKATPKGSGAEFAVTIKLLDAGNLKAGMSVYIDVIIDELVDALVIPREYVEYEGEDAYVWVLPGFGGDMPAWDEDMGGADGDYGPGPGAGVGPMPMPMPMPMPRTADMPVMEEGMDADKMLEGEFMDDMIGDMDLDFGEGGPVEFEEPEAVRTLVILGKEIDGMIEVLEGLSEGDMIENRSAGGMDDWGGGMDHWGGGMMPMGGGVIRF